MLINETSGKNELLDQEWVDLILAALDMGISENDIKQFLQTQN
ncbi:anti-repressor SinI family protein [Bacillus timonensis]|nr:anti-repressor SinI family protein [Bacillus timonensis]